MKNYIKMAIAVIMITFAACKKDKVTINDAVFGSYRVSSFVDDGTDQTAQFTPYVFTFDNKGNLNIDSGGMVNMCGWTKSNGVYHFNMQAMHSNNVLSELDDDWLMTTSDDTICKFADDNPNRNCTFTFHKN